MHRVSAQHGGGWDETSPGRHALSARGREALVVQWLSQPVVDVGWWVQDATEAQDAATEARHGPRLWEGHQGLQARCWRNTKVKQLAFSGDSSEVSSAVCLKFWVAPCLERKIRHLPTANVGRPKTCIDHASPLSSQIHVCQNFTKWEMKWETTVSALQIVCGPCLWFGKLQK